MWTRSCCFAVPMAKLGSLCSLLTNILRTYHSHLFKLLTTADWYVNTETTFRSAKFLNCIDLHHASFFLQGNINSCLIETELVKTFSCLWILSVGAAYEIKKNHERLQLYQISVFTMIEIRPSEIVSNLKLKQLAFSVEIKLFT